MKRLLFPLLLGFGAGFGVWMFMRDSGSMSGGRRLAGRGGAGRGLAGYTQGFAYGRPAAVGPLVAAGAQRILFPGRAF